MAARNFPEILLSSGLPKVSPIRATRCARRIQEPHGPGWIELFGPFRRLFAMNQGIEYQREPPHRVPMFFLFDFANYATMIRLAWKEKVPRARFYYLAVLLIGVPIISTFHAICFFLDGLFFPDLRRVRRRPRRPHGRRIRGQSCRG